MDDESGRAPGALTQAINGRKEQRINNDVVNKTQHEQFLKRKRKLKNTTDRMLKNCSSVLLESTKFRNILLQSALESIRSFYNPMYSIEEPFSLNKSSTGFTTHMNLF